MTGQKFRRVLFQMVENERNLYRLSYLDNAIFLPSKMKGRKTYETGELIFYYIIFKFEIKIDQKQKAK